MGLILAHDLLATAVAAVLASFYIRFEAPGLAERWPAAARHAARLRRSMPAASISIFGLYKSKWRFTSLPDLMNIVRGRDGAGGVAAGARLRAGRAERSTAPSSSARSRSRSTGSCRSRSSRGSRVAYRYFRYARTLQHARAADTVPTLVLGRAADAEVLLRAIESGAVQQDPAGRHPVAVARRPRPVDPRRPGARRSRRPRAASCAISPTAAPT